MKHPRRFLVALVVAVSLAVAPLSSQTFTAQIQQFWNLLRTGAIAFTTGRVDTNGYMNFGPAVGAAGYGVRDLAGIMQVRNNAGVWTNILAGGVGPAPVDATYITQIANATLTNEQPLGALATGVLLSTTATGVVSSLGIGTVAQALIGGATPAFGNTITVTGIATTPTDGWVLTNPTAADGATVQMPPRFRQRGYAWTGAASQSLDWTQDFLPVSAATPTSTYRWRHSLNGAAYTTPMSLTSAGAATFLGDMAGLTGTFGNTQKFQIRQQTVLADAQGGGIIDSTSGGGIVSWKSGAAALVLGDTTTTSIYWKGSALATSTAWVIKKVTAIPDNAATDVLTVTIPNGNHAGTLRLTFTSSNGGADAFESTRTASGQIAIARTTGVNAVATAATIDDAAIATVAAGATHTLAYNVSAIAGAVGATNTFTVQVTIDDSGNLGGNQCVVLAELINTEATGITVQ